MPIFTSRPGRSDKVRPTDANSSSASRARIRALFARRERGFALIVVLWIVGLLTLAVLGIGHTARTYVSTSAMAIDAARLRAAAQAGLNLGLLRLLETRGALAPVVSSGSFTCRFDGDITLHIKLEDEAGKVNINLAEPELLGALLVGLGLEESQARAAASAIVTYRQPPDQADAFARFDAQAGKLKGGPFDSVEELDQVDVLSPLLVRRMRSLTTVHSDVRGIDPKAASAHLLALLSRRAHADPPPIADSLFAPPIEPRFAATSGGRVFAITAQAARGEHGAAAEQIIVRLGATRGRTHTFLAWRIVDTIVDGGLDAFAASDC